MRQGREPNHVIRLVAYDLLVSTNRSTSARGYDLLQHALQRLRSVDIVTNIKTGDESYDRGFGLIDEWEIIRSSAGDTRMENLEIVLSQWLYNAVLNHEVLTLHRDYFRLDGGIERRVYELCRKHCGHQDKWAVNLDTLHKKSGSTAPLKRFSQAMRALVARDYLPEYHLTLKKQKLTAYPRSCKGGLQELKDMLGV